MGIIVNENQIGGGTSNSSHNIGDIFYTTRTDNSLNGAVECNGSQYNFSDFDSNLQNLLDEGKLPYVSIGEFDSMVTNQGGCDSFGYGPGDSYYGWNHPMYGGNYYTKSETPQKGDDLFQKENNVMERVGQVYGLSETYGVQIDGDGHYASRESSLDEIDDTPTTYFKVPKKLSRVLVRTQKPTADNNYTWYNVYADGWVEQGGNKAGIASSEGVTVDLPISMSDNHYSNQTSISYSEDSTSVLTCRINSTKTTSTSFNVITTYASANSTGYGIYSFKWRLAGYAAPSEYTKDKWNYQNVQVERCMVQLFNSTTDTAVATCNQVLADVSALNQGDYVIETQFPTAENNYSWYRLYKSGWVEQGGYVSYTGSWIEGHIDSVVLPIEFANTDYRIMIGRTLPADGDILTSYDINKTTTGFGISSYAVNQSSAVASNWFAVGMSAQRNN